MKVAILGLGQIGSKYDEDINTSFSHRNSILRNLNKSEKFYIDKDLNYVKSVAKKDNAHFSDSFDILPKFIDLAIISVPTKDHLNCFLKLISNRKIKKIILEKPVGMNYEETKIIRNKSKENGTKIFVNYMRNTLPETEEIYKYIKIKSPENFDIEISHSGSFINNGSHFLALIAYLTKLPIEKFKINHLENSIKFLSFYKNRIIFKNNLDVKYPSFRVSIMHESGIIEYSEKENRWKIFEFKKKSSNPKLNKLHEVAKYKLNLELAQDHFLKFALSEYNPDSKKIDIDTAMIVQKLLN